MKFARVIVQVAQVLLTLPYSFSQLGMLSGILFQLFYGLMGSWTAYLISILYVEYRTRKEREKADFRNHVIQVRRNSAVFASQSSCILLVCIGRRLNFCSELNHAHLSAVVRGAGRAAREALEERRPGLQLHVPALRLCHPAHRLRKVPPHMPTTAG
jgi:hypothetical protein